MHTYWSNSKFADKLRGTEKPYALQSGQWDIWHNTAKKAHSVRYWMAETLIDNIQSVLGYPYNKQRDLQSYISNRWIHHSHALTASKSNIARGGWCDLADRILYCMFDELVDFIELEKAWMEIMSNDDVSKIHPKWFRRLRTIRNPAAGIKYLKWEINLSSKDHNSDSDDADALEAIDKALGRQSCAAQEILDLYTWWTSDRPKRIDPSDESGWSKYCENKPLINDQITEDDRKHVREVLDHLSTLEKKHDDEDQEMLIRLIKIRNSLWT